MSGAIAVAGQPPPPHQPHSGVWLMMVRWWMNSLQWLYERAARHLILRALRLNGTGMTAGEIALALPLAISAGEVELLLRPSLSDGSVTGSSRRDCRVSGQRGKVVYWLKEQLKERI